VDTKRLNKKQEQEFKENHGEIVRDFKVGNTRIMINDAYCRDKTPADVQAILARISHRAQEQLTAQAIYAQS
jgi:hypothetical protein